MTNEIFDRPQGRTLSQIIESMIETDAVIIDNGGELTPELEEFIAQNEADMAKKIDGYNAAYREQAARAEALKNEIARLQALKKTAENSAKRIKEVLKWNMDRLGTRSVNGTTCKAYFTTSTAVECKDEELVGLFTSSLNELKAMLPDYIDVEFKVNKTNLRTALQKNEADKENRDARLDGKASIVKTVSVVLK